MKQINFKHMNKTKLQNQKTVTKSCFKISESKTVKPNTISNKHDIAENLYMGNTLILCTNHLNKSTLLHKKIENMVLFSPTDHLITPFELERRSKMSPWILFITVFSSVFLSIWAASLLWRESSIKPFFGFIPILSMMFMGFMMMLLFSLLIDRVQSRDILVYLLYSGCVFFFLIQLGIVSSITRRLRHEKR